MMGEESGVEGRGGDDDGLMKLVWMFFRGGGRG
jgi:hypothetical protein